MIAEGTDAAKVTDEQIARLAADVETFSRAHKISRKVVARAMGYSPGVISEFLAGKYQGNRGQVAIDLDNWLIEEEQRRSRPETTQFVWTNVALEIKAAANYCLDKRTIGLVYGPDTSGIGKTMALQAIYEEMGPRRASLCSIDKVDANPTGLLKKLCTAIGVQDSGSNKQRFERVVEKLLGRSHLLLIDEIHSLRGAKEDKPFYILMNLFQRTKGAQLWCGTSDMVAYLDRQRIKAHDESLAQIRRRIFPRIDLMEGLRGVGAGGGGGGTGGGEPLVTVEQVREMFARNTLKLAGAAARFLCQLCNLPDSGAIGLCVQLVEYATMLAELRNAKVIDLPLLQEAMRRGFTPARADLLLAHVDQSAPAPIARSA
jgi:hypothetical protein